MDSRRRFRQNEAAKLDPIIFRDGRGAKRNDEDGFSQCSNREAYFITLNVAKDDGNGMAKITQGEFMLFQVTKTHIYFNFPQWTGLEYHDRTKGHGRRTTRDCWRFVKVPSRARPLSTYFSRRTRTLPEENTKSLSGYLFAAQWLMTQISEKREPSPAVRGSSRELFFVRST